MKKHLKMVSGLGVSMALFGVARPAHASWHERTNATRVNASISGTAATVGSTGSGYDYHSVPTTNGDFDLYYDWDGEDAPEQTEYTARHTMKMFGPDTIDEIEPYASVKAEINVGATGSGSSTANIIVGSTSFSDDEGSSGTGVITHYPGTISVPRGFVQEKTVNAVLDPVTMTYSVHVVFSMSFSAFCQQSSLSYAEAPVFPNPVGTNHNVAPGSALTSPVSIRTDANALI